MCHLLKINSTETKVCNSDFIVFLFLFFLPGGGAYPVAGGSSQARDQTHITAVARATAVTAPNTQPNKPAGTPHLIVSSLN